MSKSIYFFADKEDFKPVLSAFEEGKALAYVLTGLHDVKNQSRLKSLNELSDLGMVSNGDWNHSKNFLVFPASTDFVVRDVPQRAGGTKYAIDQMANPASITLKPSGVLKEGVLVAGSATTVSSDAFSTETFNFFSKLIKKQFKKVGTFYVGPNALQKMKSGWRLVTNDKSPAEYDLKE